MDKYKWNLTKFYKNEKEFNDEIIEAEKLLKELVKYKGKILKSSESLLNVLTTSDKLSLLYERLYVYSYLGYYDNMVDSKFINYKDRATKLWDKVSSECAFITPEILSNDYDYVKKLLNEKDELKKYSFMLERMFRDKEHILSESEEKLLANIRDSLRVSSNAYDTLCNVDVKYGKVLDDLGNRVELTTSNYIKFLSSKNRNVRKCAFKKEYQYYKNHINTISELYIGRLKTSEFFAKTKKYDNVLSMYLFDDKVSNELYENLIKVTNDNVKYLQEYYNIKSKMLGEKMHMYDIYVNTSVISEKNIEYEEGIKIVNEALKSLGKDYLDSFNKLLNTNSVDVYPKDKKRSGAYEWACYGVDPYVSLNYENNIDSVSTLAHEMGHAMHSYYSNLNQEHTYADYPIFLAEIASTVNEVLLSNYLIDNTKNKDEKIYYLVEFLDKFKATVYRQVMFAEFEYKIHKYNENGKTITKDLLCKEYYKLNKKQFGSSLVVDKDISYEWARISHFYTPFYVYKYATGFISALVIANKLVNEKNFKDKYIKFLSSGGSNYPLDLLMELGIDISDFNTLNRAFELFNEKVCLLKKLESGE